VKLRLIDSVKTTLTTDPAVAGRAIRLGGIAAFPTETVYGLGADAFNEDAIGKVFEAKQRPPGNPLIAHISSLKQIDDLAAEITDSAAKLIQKFFPGPLTVVLKKRSEVPLIATAGLDSIGIRMPRNERARRFLNECGRPVVAPSANISGRPSPTTWTAVYEDLNGRIDCILKGGRTEIGLESTVVDCRTEATLLLRFGSVSLEEIQEVIPSARSVRARDNAENRSPGLLYKHYSPNARVRLLANKNGSISGNSNAVIGLTPPSNGFEYTKVVASLEEYAHELFEFFRECDRRGIETIYCEEAKGEGIAAALMDRIKRASEAGG
jgi:L-threonylcarbamoyladenylate synthase